MELRCAFSPVVDGKVLKEFPSSGAVKSKIPLLAGTVAEEANIFTLPVPAVALLIMGLKLGLKPQKAADAGVDIILPVDVGKALNGTGNTDFQTAYQS